MHLVDLADLPNVTIQIVPFEAGKQPGMKGHLEIVELEDTPDENVVYLEGPSAISSMTIRRNQELPKTLKRIKQMALKPSDSVDLLREAAGEMT